MADTKKPLITSGDTSSIDQPPLQRINQNTGRQNKSRRMPQVRKVNDFIIFMDEVLGEGQYGKVCKAQLAVDLMQDVNGSKKQAVRSTVDTSKKIYACKIIDISDISEDDLACIHKEVKIHGMIRSPYSVRLHQTIKTGSNIYMMQEYANGFDLAYLLKLRNQIKQEEARTIIKQVVLGIKDVQTLGIVHRDVKLANILLHFPNNQQLESMNKLQKKAFLAACDLTKIEFQAKISDFGLSTILDGTNTNLSICGTPLYSSPQLLKKRGYNEKVDTWALGVMLYEMLVGLTPFHSYEMKDLIAKINDGRYKVSLNEDIKVETCLFLVQCLQMLESDRIPVEELSEHPFIAEELLSTPLSTLDIDTFNSEVKHTDKVRSSSISSANQSLMASRFDDTVIQETDVILSTKSLDQVRILLSQLVNSTNFTEAQFDMTNSTYFNKHMDASVIQRPAQDSYVNQENSSFRSSEVSGNKGHFDSNAPDSTMDNKEGPEQILREEDLDEGCQFIFPNRDEGEEQKQAEGPVENQMGQLKSTQELLKPFIDKQKRGVGQSAESSSSPGIESSEGITEQPISAQAAASTLPNADLHESYTSDEEERKADKKQKKHPQSARNARPGKFKRFFKWVCQPRNSVIVDESQYTNGGKRRPEISRERVQSRQLDGSNDTPVNNGRQQDDARIRQLRRETYEELKQNSSRDDTSPSSSKK